MRAFHLLLATLLLAPVSGCLDVTVPGERPLSVELVATPEVVAVGDSVRFVARAEGRSLLKIVFGFGDGDSASVATFGAQTAESEQSHAYDEPGTYPVSAVAVESVPDSARAEISVTVTPASN